MQDKSTIFIAILVVLVFLLGIFIALPKEKAEDSTNQEANIQVEEDDSRLVNEIELHIK